MDNSTQQYITIIRNGMASSVMTTTTGVVKEEVYRQLVAGCEVVELILQATLGDVVTLN